MFILKEDNPLLSNRGILKNRTSFVMCVAREAFTYLLVGMVAELKRKTGPLIAKAVGADAQALHHVVAYAPWSMQELRTRRLTLLRQALDGRPFV